jgi:hypothetical protein
MQGLSFSLFVVLLAWPQLLLHHCLLLLHDLVAYSATTRCDNRVSSIPPRISISLSTPQSLQKYGAIVRYTIP